jgi:hypothetical protein
MRPVNYDRLPAHMQEGMKRYIEDRIAPGGFACSVLANDFIAAVTRADETNVQCLRDWAMWLLWDCPREAWGSYEKIDAWLKGGNTG